MIPLTLAETGEEAAIHKIAGPEKTRQFLENLGFVPGCKVKVVTQLNGNVIVQIRETRVAVSKEMASKIFTSIKGGKTWQH